MTDPVPDSAFGGAAFRGVVAIDGPAGTGKSTVARGVARRLGVRYLDTGAMYRAAAWLALRRALSDDTEIAAAVRAARIELSTDPDVPVVSVDGESVTAAIRSAEVIAAVSAVAAIPAVRTTLIEQQRKIIGAGGIVVEGRDIAAVVAPDAQTKVFLTADENTRAARRSREEQTTDIVAVAAAIGRRDGRDTVTAPLRPAAGAVTIDTTALGVDEVVDTVLALVRTAAS